MPIEFASHWERVVKKREFTFLHAGFLFFFCVEEINANVSFPFDMESLSGRFSFFFVWLIVSWNDRLVLFFPPTSSFPHYSAVLCVNQLQFVLLYYSLDTIELRILLSLDFQRFVLDFSRQVNPEIVISHVRERIITEEWLDSCRVCHHWAKRWFDRWNLCAAANREREE